MQISVIGTVVILNEEYDMMVEVFVPRLLTSLFDRILYGTFVLRTYRTYQGRFEETLPNLLTRK